MCMANTNSGSARLAAASGAPLSDADASFSPESEARRTQAAFGSGAGSGTRIVVCRTKDGVAADSFRDSSQTIASLPSILCAFVPLMLLSR